MGFEQSFADGFAERIDVSGDLIFVFTEEYLAGEAVTVGMQTVGSDTDGDVSGADLFAGDKFLLFDDTGDHADEVEVVAVHTGHFGSFATQHCAIGCLTSISNAAKNFFIKRRTQLANTDVIHKINRLPIDVMPSPTTTEEMEFLKSAHKM